MKKKVTMKDIADYLQLDRTTVSKALANPPRVSEKTVKRVRQAAEMLGYRKDPFASGLMTGKNALLGIVLADIKRGIYAPLVSNFQQTAKQFHYGVILQYVDPTQDDLTHAIDLLKQQRVSGVTFISGAASEKHNPLLIELAQSGVAVNTTGREYISDRIDRIRFNNYQAAYDATAYLIELGHVDIAYVTNRVVSGTLDERLQGYLQAMKDHGLAEKHFAVERKTPLTAGFEVKSAYELVRKTWGKELCATAIVGANDNYALGILHALKDEGVHVPAQVSVLGFDDLHAELSVPSLTSMRMPVWKSGETAVKLLMRRIENPDKEQEYVMLEYERMERESTAAAPRNKI